MIMSGYLNKLSYCIMKGLKQENHALSHTIRDLLSTAQLHKETFLPYKNYCNGERAIVVCGAGPSMNDYIPIKGAIHIAVNRAFINDKINFDFIFSQDYSGIKMVEDKLVAYKPESCVKFLGTQNPKFANLDKCIPEQLIIRCKAKKFDTDWYIQGASEEGIPVVDIDRKPICNMQTVGISVMQLALYMNPSKIYIVGCDMSGNYFAKGNQTEEEVKKEAEQHEKIWATRREKMLKHWRNVKEFAEIYYPDTEIITVNPIGLKGVFTDFYQNEKYR